MGVDERPSLGLVLEAVANGRDDVCVVNSKRAERRTWRRGALCAALATLTALATAPPARSAGAGDCAPLPPATGTVIDVSADQADRLPELVRAAPAGATIRLADGTYRIEGGDYDRRLIFRRPGVTLRSASGDPASVVLDGTYDAGTLIHLLADRVTIAELTLTRARDHLVQAHPGDGGPDVRGLSLHRLQLVDSGEQFVKASGNEARSHWVDAATVACSRFLMTATGRRNVERGFGCYTGGIDVHSGRGWRVRDNVFEGIYCEDGEVAEHAVHFWSASRGTVVENNVIVDCSRGIGFGLVEHGQSRPYPDDPYPESGYVGHYDGVIRNNAVLASIRQYDTGIELAQARGARVLHNTVVETPRATGAFSSIDYRFRNTDVEIRNNLVRNITARDGARATVDHNGERFPLAWLLDPSGGDFHLRPDAGGALERGLEVSGAGLDIDGVPHAHGAPDLGADELTPGGPAPGRMSLRLSGGRRVRGRNVAPRGRRLRVIGSVRPWFAGETIRVRFRRRGRTVRRLTPAVREAGGGGHFTVLIRPRSTGWLTIHAHHPASDRLAAFEARPLRVLIRG